MATAKDRWEFIQVLREEFPAKGRYEVEQFAKRLMRYANKSQRIAELLSSVDLGNRYEEVEKEDEENDQRIEALAASWGMRVRLGGDPRGFTVSVFLPSERSNSWGGKENGWGVPASGYSAAELRRLTGY